MGTFRLNPEQIARLGNTMVTQVWDDEGENVIEQTRGALNYEEFPPFTLDGVYFYSSAAD